MRYHRYATRTQPFYYGLRVRRRRRQPCLPLERHGEPRSVDGGCGDVPARSTLPRSRTSPRGNGGQKGLRVAYMAL